MAIEKDNNQVLGCLSGGMEVSSCSDDVADRLVMGGSDRPGVGASVGVGRRLEQCGNKGVLCKQRREEDVGEMD